MSLAKEFKAFVMRGNVVDLAVGVVIGAAFGKIVSSLVSDLIMPPIGMLLGGVDFSALGLTLKAAAGAESAVVVRYGVFINTIIDFLIVAAAIFVVVKVVNQMSRKKPEDTPTTKDCPQCLSTIPLAAKKCAHCCSVL